MMYNGTHPVNEPLNDTEYDIDYEKYSFRCKVNKGYGKNQPVSYIFTFIDGSEIFYNRSDQYIQKIKDYGMASEFTLDKCNKIFDKKLKRIMLQAKNLYCARGRYANYDDFQGQVFY